MEITFDPRDAESVAKVSEMLGLDKQTSTADESAQRTLILRLQDQLNEKRQEIAKLIAKLKGAAEASESAGGPAVNGTIAICGTTFARCILELEDGFLLKWPAIGKGGLAKMRKYAAENFGEGAAKGEPEEAPKKESPSKSGPEGESSGGDTDESADDWGDDDAGPADEAPVKRTLQDIRGLIQSKYIKAGKLELAKKIIKKEGFDNLPAISPDAFNRVYDALTKG